MVGGCPLRAVASEIAATSPMASMSCGSCHPVLVAVAQKMAVAVEDMEAMVVVGKKDMEKTEAHL